VAQPKLVIVESPSKAKTINKYLGKEFVVMSSKGHLIDLPKSRLAIDIPNGFKPEYKVVHGRTKDLKELKSKAKSASQILLATDPDREGEAIAWHLFNALKDTNADIHRITFNEITSEAIRESIKHVGEIDVNLVNAQQARRILDRLVGYNLSPLLWKKVKAGLSAGRVQSVALRIICEREAEIDAFVPVEFWDLDLVLQGHGHNFPARVVKFQDRKMEKIHSKAEADSLIDALKKNEIRVEDVIQKSLKRKALPPYTTSKLQQDAVNRLGFTAKKTMQIAQQLYEGIEIKGEGLTGLITYMRTDSTRVAPTAIESVREFIAEKFGKEYLPATPNLYEKSKGSQDAHEAIRPTSVFRTPESLADSLERSTYRLYKMIWERFVASQMGDAVFRNTVVLLKSGEYSLSISGSAVEFPGYNRVYAYMDTKENLVRGIEKLQKGDLLTIEKVEPVQKFTQPPPRFTDATLVKVLEESGIGRPSTYAPTINTLISRYYIVRNGKQMVPTILGKMVNDLLVKNFPEILNIGFTATMEKELDEVAESRRAWVSVVEDFYTPFAAVMERAHKEIEKINLKMDEKTDLVCEKCGMPMLKKLGRYGYFLACSGFPKCRNILPLPLGKCPKCETGSVVKKMGKKRRPFYGCSSYPACDFVSFNEVLEMPCPKCGKALFKVMENKQAFKVCFAESCGFKEPLEKQDASISG
jgi:DNA topoisomerase-1